MTKTAITAAEIELIDAELRFPLIELGVLAGVGAPEGALAG